VCECGGKVKDNLMMNACGYLENNEKSISLVQSGISCWTLTMNTHNEVIAENISVVELLPGSCSLCLKDFQN
jgi:hypothetical protein